MARKRTRRSNKRKPSFASASRMPHSLDQRLHVEALEDRRMLAVATVGDISDVVNGDTSSIANLIATPGGAGISLREAITAANNTAGADTIDFATSLSGLTITLGGIDLQITEALTIDATSLAANVTIDGDNASRVFNIFATTGDFTFSGLTLTGGRTTDSGLNGRGGAIKSRTTGSLTFDQSTVSGNSTTGGADGGGIYSRYGDIRFTSSIVSGNSTAGDDARGGGIYSYFGDITLNSSTFSENSTSGVRSGGGGIYSRNGNITLTSSTVSGNSSGESGGGGIGSRYGDITLISSTVSGNSTTGDHAHGGGIFSSRGNITLTNSTVSGNSTIGDDGDGGGISGSTVTLNSSTVSGNSTAGSSAGGGGIKSNHALTLTNSTVSGNSTTGDSSGGGGIQLISFPSNTVTLTNSTVTGNSTAGDSGIGGGIFASGSVTLTSSTVSGNSTAGDHARGGGIFSRGDDLGIVTLTNSTVSGNSTAGDDARGGGIFSRSDITLTSSTVTDNNADYSNATGGGIWNESDTITIVNSIVAGNTAGGGSPDIEPGTGIFSVNFSLIGTVVSPDAGTSGDNVVTNDPLLGPLADNGGPTETHTLLVGSSAIDAGDPVIAGPPPFDQRGEPFGRQNGTIDIGAYEIQTLAVSFFIVTTTTDELDYSNSDVSLREAINSANGSFGANVITFGAALSGQAIALDGTELAISEAVTIDATSLAAHVTIDANELSRIFNITATTGGFTLAGLTLTGGKTTGDNSLFDSNFSGGAVRSLTSGSLTIDQSTVSGNSTTGGSTDGGGIFSSGTVTLTSSTVSGNSTAGNFAQGGGIFSLGDITLTSSTVSGNSAAGDGGGIFASSGMTKITFSTISDNTAGGYGGGILNSGTMMLEHTIVAKNTSTTTSTNDVDTFDGSLSGFFNLIGDGSGLYGALTHGLNGNQVGTAASPVDPLLGPLANNGGPIETHALLVGSSAIDAGDSAAVAGVGDTPLFDQRGTGFDRVAAGRIDIGAFELQPLTEACDFDADGDCDIDDIDALIMEIAAGTNGAAFDMTSDGLVNLADRDQWLADAGALNLVSGNPYLLGDSNLDGTVDGQDFLIWNGNKFQSTGKWSQADWNADGTTDGQDFLIWNSNKFQSADAPTLPDSGSPNRSQTLRAVAFTSLFDDSNRQDDRNDRLSNQAEDVSIVDAVFVSL